MSLDYLLDMKLFRACWKAISFYNYKDNSFNIMKQFEKFCLTSCLKIIHDCYIFFPTSIIKYGNRRICGHSFNNLYLWIVELTFVKRTWKA